MDEYVARILAHPKRMMGYLFCISALCIYFGFSVKMDNSMEVWFPRSHAALGQYQRFLKDFGNDEFILIASEHGAGFTYQELLLDQKLTEAFEKVSGVEYVLSLSNLFNRTALDFNVFREGVLVSSLFRRTVISDNGQVTAIILQLSQEGLRKRQELVDQVRAIIALLVPNSAHVYVAGPPVFNTELDQMSRQVAARSFPLLFCVVELVLFLLFRSLAGVLLPAYIMILSLLLVCGWMGCCGGSLNMVTIALLPLMMVFSLSYSIYMVSCYHNHMGAESTPPSEQRTKEIIARSCKDVCFPVFLCALTTAIGFGSLMVSDVTPVRDFGFFSALGICSTFLLVMCFLPPALVFFPPPSVPSKSSTGHKKLQHLFRSMSPVVVNNRRQILAACLILFFLALSGIVQLRIETHALKFFPQNSRIIQAYTFIEDRLTGLSPIEIVIEAKKAEEKNLLPPYATLTEVKLLQDFLSRQKEIISSQSIANILEDDIMKRLARQPVPYPTPGGSDAAVEGYFNVQRQAIRVSARARTVGSSEYQRLLERINHYLNRHFTGEFMAYTTGIVPLIVEMQDTLLTYLIESFSITVGIIALIFLLLTRSLRNMLVCMIPNVLPIAMVLGFMGWAGIKLDIATIMIASIALGIAVDDTFHFLAAFNKVPFEQGYDQRTRAALGSTGEAMLFTSVVNMCGFAVLCLSDFRPMINFGLLTSISIVFALIGDLVVLPASLAAFQVKLR